MSLQNGNQSLKDYQRDLGTGPSGIGGWLILLTIGILLQPIIQILTIMEYSIPALNDAELWVAFVNHHYESLFAFLVYYELIINITLALLGIFILVTFLQRKKFVPKLLVWFWIGSLLVILMDEIIANQIFDFDDFAFNGTMRAMITCAIWIPYIKLSKRVRNTFVV